jgi:hypothetical protein
MTFVYFFHREPNQFEGGELRLHDSGKRVNQPLSAGGYQTIVPQQNQIVFFPCSTCARNHSSALPVAGFRRQPVHGKRMAAPVKDTAWLEWIAGLMGAASRQRHTATMLPHQFHCLLDELPLHLIPQHFLNRQSCRHDPAQELFLNPECSVLACGSGAGRTGSPSGFARRVSTCRALWLGCVTLPCHRCIRSGWVHVSKRRFRDFAPGNLHPLFPTKCGSCWQQAGILTPPIIPSVVLRSGLKSSRVSAQAFRERNYAPLSNLIHPFHLAALRRYYRHAIRRGAIRLGDEQSSRRYVAHNEPVARFFHHQIANAVSAVVGEPSSLRTFIWRPI